MYVSYTMISATIRPIRYTKLHYSTIMSVRSMLPYYSHDQQLTTRYSYGTIHEALYN